MQRLIQLSNLRAAQAFIDYMATKHIRIESHVQPNQTVELWLVDDEQLAFVQQELEQFLINPTDKRYLDASWQTNDNSTNIPYPRVNYLDMIKQRAGWLTLSVIVLCIVNFIFMQIVGISDVMALFSFPEGPEQFGEIWRWVTPAFIHFSVLHISFNLVMWWYIGGNVEQRLGSGKLFIIAFFSAIISNYVEYIFNGNNFGGLSGVVYALIGYGWLMGEKAPQTGVYLERALMIVSVVWLVAGYFGIFGMAIANAAHLSGLLVGLTMALIDIKKYAK